MAAWSGLLWHKTIDMLEHGTDTCVIPKSPLFINCNESNFSSGLKRTQPNRRLKNPGTTMLQEFRKNLNLSDLNIKQTSRGSYFSLSDSLRTKSIKKRELSRGCHGSQNCRLKVITDQDRTDQGRLTTSAEYSSSVPYARLGWWVE